jgi:3-oxoacyl-[acyl-carrier protein] reductase
MSSIVITGASTGIGAATALELAPGNTIYIHYYRSADAARDIAGKVEKAGGKAVLIQADLASNEGCEKLAREVKSDTDILDVLVNNAGGLLKRHGLDETSWETAVDTFSLNVFSAMRTTALLIPLLRKSGGGNIVNISSVAARNGSPTASTYAAAKGAIDTFTRGLAAGLAPDIRANSIAPGIILTPFHDKSTPPEQLEKFMKSTPVGHAGYPEEIARAVRFILESPFLTGEAIDINGGMNMR